MSSPKYHLQMLGGLSMREISTDRAVLVGQRKRLALLAILAADSSTLVSRARLLALLWPDADEVRARNALKQLVYAIRQELGDAAIRDESGTIQIAPAVVAADIQRFREALAENRPIDAAAEYHGPFLDGVYLRDAPAFERWVDSTRQALTADYARVLEQLVASSLSTGNGLEAARWARTLVGLDPLSTRSTILLIKALDAAGDPGAAIRHAESHAALLREELNIDAPAELRAATALLRKSASNVSPPDPREDHREDAPPVAATIEGSASSPRTHRVSISRRFAVARVAVAAIAGITWTAMAMTGRKPRPARTGGLTQVTHGKAAETQPAVSPDGRWLAFVATPVGEPEMSLPRMRVFIQQVVGGSAVRVIEDSTEQELPAWSPDGTRIVFQTRTGISVVSALGGTPEQLIAGIDRGLSLGGWSHDGKRIAFADTLGIWVRDIGRGTEHLVTHARLGHSPAWSPDDSRLAFVVGTPNIANISPSAIWIVPSMGGVAREVTDALHLNISPVFSTDGRSLFFVSTREGGRDIYEQSVLGQERATRGATRLTTGANAWGISLSADGKSLLYGAEIMRSNVWSAPISTEGSTPASESRQVTYGDQEVECLSVSRDGAWLLYDANGSGNQDIYKLPLAGGDPIQLTHDPSDDFCAKMSPNAREIAFYSFRGTGRRRAFTMMANGAAQQPVDDSTYQDQEWGPDWSPDGKRLAFGVSQGGPRQVYVVSRQSDGRWGNRKKVSEIAAGVLGWSPDGRYLAVTTDSGLGLLSADRGDLRVLVPESRTGRPEGFYAAWGPDSSVVFYRTLDAQGIVSFWSIPVSGGGSRLLLRLKDAQHASRRPEFATDGRRLFFTLARDDASIWRLELRQP